MTLEHFRLPKTAYIRHDCLCFVSGVIKIMVVSMSVHMSKEALRLTHLYPDYLYCTIGVHPHEAKLWNEDSYSSLKDLASKPECVAIGECGLDYNRDFSPQDLQRTAFEAQVINL